MKNNYYRNVNLKENKILENKIKKTMSRKVMKLVDPSSGLMECKVCGSRHLANLMPAYKQKDGKSGFYYYGSCQCINKCRLPEKGSFSSSLMKRPVYLKEYQEGVKFLPY